MAGSNRRDLADQWRPEDSGFDRRVSRRSPLRNPRAPRSRSHSLPRGPARRRSLSPLPRDLNTYRPTQRARSPRPPPYRRGRSPSPSWNRGPRSDRSRERIPARHYSPGPPRRRTPSPTRVGDSYIPGPRRRSRSPVTSTYRPEYRSARGPFPPERSYRPNNEPPPKRRKASHSPAAPPTGPANRPRGQPPSAPRAQRQAEERRPRARSPTTSPRVSRKERRRRAARSRSRRRREHPGPHLEDAEEGGADMSWSYYGNRGGAPRPPRYDYGPPHSGASTPFMSAHQNSAHGSPIHPPQGRGGYGYASHHGSPYHGYPPQHAPYRQSNYPPAASPYHHGPPSNYGGSPPYGPPHAYPPHRGGFDGPRRGGFHNQIDRRSSVDSRAGSDAGSTQRGGRPRGRYQNLSWTPGSGNRGGGQLPPKSSNASREGTQGIGDDDDDRPSKGSQPEDRRQNDARDERADEDDDDNDSRMSMSISPQSPDRKTSSVTVVSRQQKEPTSPAQTSPHPAPAAAESPTTGRISSFSKRKREPRKELRKVERIKPRPRVDPEHAKSDSVYYRKPGNESVVGSGTYGKVFKAIHVYTKEKVALKKIRMEGERDGFPVTAIREVKLLQSLHSPHVVSLREVMVERNDCYMVFEYLSHDLTGLLNHPTFKLNAAHKKHLGRQLFAGLDYLHKRGVLHRDIKAANILISSEGQLKLADFGLARFYAKRRQLDYTNRVITIWYRSPELLLGETQYGPEVDMWSAACVLVEIFTRHAIFPGDGGEISQLDKIYHIMGTPSVSDWPGLKELPWYELLRPSFEKPSTFEEKYSDKMSAAAFSLLQDMLCYDPHKRPDAAKVLKHPYFTEEKPAEERLELENIGGDWHEFESKALRKEKERQEYERRRQKEKERKRASEVAERDAREAKRRRLEEEGGAASEDDGMMMPPD